MVVPFPFFPPFVSLSRPRLQHRLKETTTPCDDHLPPLSSFCKTPSNRPPSCAGRAESGLWDLFPSSFLLPLPLPRLRRFHSRLGVRGKLFLSPLFFLPSFLERRSNGETKKKELATSPRWTPLLSSPFTPFFFLFFPDQPAHISAKENMRVGKGISPLSSPPPLFSPPIYVRIWPKRGGGGGGGGERLISKGWCSASPSSFLFFSPPPPSSLHALRTFRRGNP